MVPSPPTGRCVPAREVLGDLAAADLACRAAASAAVDAFLAERDPAAALIAWFGGVTLPPGADAASVVRARVDRDLVRIGEFVSDAVNEILHHPRFQRLEASWRGLAWFCEQTEGVREGADPPVTIKVLSVSWRDLCRDLERALEFDQSQLFRKVYEAEFGQAGGHPYGLLLGDYEVSHRAPGDLDALASIAHVAGAAFAPFVAGAHPSLFGLDDFGDLEMPVDLARAFEQAEYVRWKALRKAPDSRFVALTVPRVLARTPWEEEIRGDGFRFAEDVSGPDARQYCWGTAVYAFGSVVVRAMAEFGWPAAIRGTPEGGGGGLVTGLPVHTFRTDARGTAMKSPTDVVVTDVRERELEELGFLALARCKETPWAAYHGSASIQIPEKFDTAAATANARISSMIQYMLCVARVAHHVKVMGRDRIGSFATPEDCERQLQTWLLRYTTSDDRASDDHKARFPLREAEVSVQETPGRPGAYACVIHLRPHFQLDQVATSIRLVTEMVPIRAG